MEVLERPMNMACDDRMGQKSNMDLRHIERFDLIWRINMAKLHEKFQLYGVVQLNSVEYQNNKANANSITKAPWDQTYQMAQACFVVFLAIKYTCSFLLFTALKTG